MSTLLSRRGLLVAGAATLAASAIGPVARASPPPPPQPAARRRVLRFAHLTDPHLQPERGAGEGLAACLKHAQSLADPPQLIATGGDLVFDVYDQAEPRARLLFDQFAAAMRAECSLPVFHTLGNHDIWGWNRAKSGLSGSEARYGKAWACEVLGLDKPYHTHDRAGWRFIHLDSVAPDPANARYGYRGELDEAQRDWLAATLAATPRATPVVVVSHIPILNICGLLKRKENPPIARVEPGNQHVDGVALHELFRAHGNVKLCLSGHIHLNDRVEFEGTTYICDGAVSGGWWKGPNLSCVEGYGVIDLYDDGSFDHRYHTYGWQARAEP